jgi:hypothetical protein
MKDKKTIAIIAVVAVVVLCSICGIIGYFVNNSGGIKNQEITPVGVATQATEDGVTFDLSVDKIVMNATPNSKDSSVPSDKQIVLVDIFVSYADTDLVTTENFYLANKAKPDEKVGVSYGTTVDTDFTLDTSAGSGTLPFIVSKDWKRDDIQLVITNFAINEADRKEIGRVSLADANGPTFSINTVQTLTGKSVTLKDYDGKDEFKAEALSIVRNVKDESKFSNPYPDANEEVIGVEVKVTNVSSADSTCFSDFSLGSKAYPITGVSSEKYFPSTSIKAGESLTQVLYFKMPAKDSDFKFISDAGSSDEQSVTLN